MGTEPSLTDVTSSLPMFFADAHRALDRDFGPHAAKLSMFDHDPRVAIARLRDAGVFSLLVPAEVGGRELDPARRGAIDVRALCVVREHLGYHAPMADSLFAVQGLGSHPLVLDRIPEPADGRPNEAAHESAKDRARILSEVVRGERICAFALTEPDAGSDVASMRTVATLTGDTYALTGEKVYISNTGIADHYVVFANANPAHGKLGISAFLVEKDAPGLTLSQVPISVPHPLGRLVMKDCPARAMIGHVGNGMRLALGTLDVFRTSVGAAACGMARRALDETLARVMTRVQFGAPLAEKDLVRAKLADMATELAAARLLVYRAAWLKDHGERASTEVAMAKMYATEAAQRVVDAAVQLHGGLGVTTGSVVEQLYREVRPLRIYEGTTEIQQLIIGGALTRPAPGQPAPTPAK